MPASAAPPANTPTIVPPAPGPSAEEVAATAAQTQVSVSAMPRALEPEKPPKPGSAKAKMFAEMKKKFGGEEAHSPAEAEPQTQPDKAGLHESSGQTPPQPEGADTTPAPSPSTTTTPEPERGKKVSPWKLVDQFKERASKAEARILELEKQIVPDDKAKEALANYEALQKRAKEMEDDLRFSHAEKYDPDVLKAKEEYQRAFTRAMSELKDVTVMEGDQARQFTTNDLAELAFMPLQQAQAVAKQVFGDLAPYVMDHRNEIRRLWDTQQAKMEEIKKNGAQREQQRTEARQKAFQQLNEFITKTYQQANEEALKDPKFGQLFKPRENDPEWNSRLEKGFKFVDEAYAQSPNDPKLTPEQRADVVRKHAAIRNRAAGWSALRHDNEALRKQIADLQAELKAFKGTTPKTGGRTTDAVPEKPKGMKGLYADLQKIAH